MHASDSNDDPTTTNNNSTLLVAARSSRRDCQVPMAGELELVRRMKEIVLPESCRIGSRDSRASNLFV